MGLRGRRTLSTALFVLVVAIASAGIITGLESRRSASRLWDDAFDRAAAPHVILRAETVAALPDLTGDPRVVASSTIEERRTELVRGGDRIGAVVRAASDPSAPPVVGGPLPFAGRLAETPTEVALERSFADDLGLSIGDELQLTTRTGSTVPFTLVGTVLDFQDCFYPQCDPGVAWVGRDGSTRLGGTPTFSRLLRLDDPSSAPAFTGEQLERYSADLLGGQDWIDTRGDALSVSDFFGLFLAAFGVFVLIAAGIVVAGSVTNRVMARRREIGILKAVGVTPKQLVAAITSEHLALGGLSLVLGWIVAVFLGPSLRIGVTEVLEPEGRSTAVGSLLVAAIALTFIIVVATVLPVARIGRLTTSAALRPPTASGGRSRLAGAAAAVGAGPVVVGGLKDAFGRPVRTVLAALSIALAIVALLVTLGLDRTVDEIASRPDLTGDPWDVTVAAPGQDPAAVRSAIESASGVEAWFFESEGRRVVDGEVVLVRAVGGDPAAARYLIRDGRAMNAAGEAVAGWGFLERFGKQVGDEVAVEIDDALIPLTIVGRYAETEDTGEVLLMRWESVEAAFPGAVPERYQVVASAGVTPTRLAADLQSALGPAATVQPIVVDTEDVDAFGVAFLLVAGLVLAVALANVGATILLGVRERLRDFGVLRAVGFTPRQLVGATAVGTVALVLVALVIGVPLGLWVNDLLLQNVGKAMGYGPELGRAPSLVTASIAVLLVAGGAVAIGALTCVRSASLSATELVRYE